MANVGKSILIAGMCRAFKQDGYSVAPFCAEGMVLKTFVTIDGTEMSKMQALQSEAAGILPNAYMNPILLKPTGTMETQVIINGEIKGNMSPHEFLNQKDEMARIVMEAYSKLEKKYDIVLMEGAGSPVELSLNQYDIVNMGLAKMTNSPVLLAGDIDRGGIMAQLLGTLGLFSEEEKRYVKGLIFNKFRGIRSTLTDMIQMTEEKGKIPVMGVVPYIYTVIDDETKMNEHFEVDDNVNMVDIAVIKLPHISNYVDYNPFECVEEVSLHYASTPAEIGNPDMIMIPDTTDVYGDLNWLRENGLETRILQHAAKDKVVFGICGGYQMLGQSIEDDEKGKNHGMGLLPIATYLPENKRALLEWSTSAKFGKLEGKLAGLSNVSIEECEIQPAIIEMLPGQKSMIQLEVRDVGVQKENVYGVNAKSIFYNEPVLVGIVKCLLEAKGLDSGKMQAFSFAEYKEKQYNQIADIIRENMNLEQIYEMIQKGM